MCAVIVPPVATRAVQNLHEANAALDHPPREQALSAERFRHRIVQAVQLFRRLGLAVEMSTSSGAWDCIRNASSNEAMRASSSLVLVRSALCFSFIQRSRSSSCRCSLLDMPRADDSDRRSVSLRCGTAFPDRQREENRCPRRPAPPIVAPRRSPITIKPGRSRFSVPSPYVTQAPTEAEPGN